MRVSVAVVIILLIIRITATFTGARLDKQTFQKRRRESLGAYIDQDNVRTAPRNTPMNERVKRCCCELSDTLVGNIEGGGAYKAVGERRVVDVYLREFGKHVRIQLACGAACRVMAARRVALQAELADRRQQSRRSLRFFCLSLP